MSSPFFRVIQQTTYYVYEEKFKKVLYNASMENSTMMENTTMIPELLTYTMSPNGTESPDLMTTMMKPKYVSVSLGLQKVRKFGYKSGMNVLGMYSNKTNKCTAWVL